VSDMTTPPPEDAEAAPLVEAPREPEAATPVPAPPPPAAPATTSGGWGPPGKIRSWVAVALLGIVTCGIYLWFWSYYVFDENKRHSGDGVGGVAGVLFAIFIGIVNWFLLPSEIGNIYEKAGKPKPVRGVTGFWNLIPIAGYFIWVYKVQTAMNERWEEMGAVRA
jgi:Domain of unknown function (DUF4234)